MNNILKEVKDTDSWAEILKALAHPTRLQIVMELQGEGTKCVTDIQDILPVSQVNISQHLTVLRNAGIVNFTRDGSQRCYYITRPDFIKGIISLLENIETPVEGAKCCFR
ncbi:MAG TPA: ArsR family transcriptional regulator [Flexistipes sinusarabici]|uniref:ArsR family transcriptional regulator n=1 Tax=Flexistipes sinusarabici TaxID=2352 RepID=A0A3D5Q9V7_FLESI|nr:ArsR family transcriptional regulator [Flexistipes sinusarabici]